MNSSRTHESNRKQLLIHLLAQPAHDRSKRLERGRRGSDCPYLIPNKPPVPSDQSHLCDIISSNLLSPCHCHYPGPNPHRHGRHKQSHITMLCSHQLAPSPSLMLPTWIPSPAVLLRGTWEGVQRLIGLAEPAGCGLSCNPAG